MDFSVLLQLLLVFDSNRTNSALANTNLFFVVGMGRSGSAFLSEVLDGVSGCLVHHESPGDRRALVEAYWDGETAKQHLKGYRERLIASRILYSRCNTYGEVNSYLRYHVPALRQLWNPVIMHLVRDGRDVVRSIMNRNSYKWSDRNHTGRIRPRRGDPYFEHWNRMDRFERVCWYWSCTNLHLLEMKLPVVRFEDVIQDYEAFRNQVLTPLQIDVPHERWEREVGRPINVSLNKAFPVWEDWNNKQREQFKSTCGEVMVALGYTI